MRVRRFILGAAVVAGLTAAIAPGLRERYRGNAESCRYSNAEFDDIARRFSRAVQPDETDAGHIDYKKLAAALRRMGYDGNVPLSMDGYGMSNDSCSGLSMTYSSSVDGSRRQTNDPQGADSASALIPAGEAKRFLESAR